MRVVSGADIAHLLNFPALIDALEQAFRAEVNVPLRHHHGVGGNHPDGTLLLMPAWTLAPQAFMGVKIVTVFPGNAAHGVPSVNGSYLLMNGETGVPLAVMDGRVLTLWRTAAASALAARYLARPDASRLLMVGAGALASYLVKAHAAARPIRQVRIWNRTLSTAVGVAADLAAATGLEVSVADDLEAASRWADVISCATLSSEPLVRGDWLRAGAHIDLVGGFTPMMREADDAAVRRARLYVDTFHGGLHEAGDIVDPLRRGVIRETDVIGDLIGLTRGRVAGRETADEITLFKSVGTAIEDLAAAVLVWRGLTA